MPVPNTRARIDPPEVPRNKYALPRGSLRFMPRLERPQDHPEAWHFPGFLSGSDAPWVRELRALYAEPIAFPASISPEAGLLLHSLVLNLRPRVAVETGTFVGASTIWIAGALEESAKRKSQSADETEAARLPAPPFLHAFDEFGPIAPAAWRTAAFDGDRRAIVKERLERAGLADRVVLHAGDSGTLLLTARDDLKGAGGVDFALLDADHSVEGVTRDLWALEPVLNTGGYIILHDTIPEQCGDYPGPRHVVDHVNEIAQGLYEKCEVHLAPLN
jgi:predicted O-methyltransferase YrrM